jgi:hypothetical protein
MIHGETVRPASSIRRAIEAATIAVSHTAAGTAPSRARATVT